MAATKRDMTRSLQVGKRERDDDLVVIRMRIGIERSVDESECREVQMTRREARYWVMLGEAVYKAEA